MLHPYFETAFAHSIYKERYSFDGKEEWANTTGRVVGEVLSALPMRPMPRRAEAEKLFRLMADKRFCPGGRYLAQTGRPIHQVNNCLLMNCGDSRESWAQLSYNAEMALTSGAGIGVWYGDVRQSGSLIKGTGGIASGPVPKMCQVNDTGRHMEQGGKRRAAIWAGLPWSHPDVLDFIKVKDWPEEVRALKEKDPTFPATMDYTNISVGLDDEFFAAYGDPSNPKHGRAHKVYWAAVHHMLRHGEPGFSVNTGKHRDEVLRNACTEIVSADDSDVCNLGSLVLPRFESLKDFEQAVRSATLFLTAGSVYSDVPYPKVAEIREKNRRLGLGLIGVHEFLLKHGVRYGTDDAFELLEPWMAVYDRALEFAIDHQDRLGLSHSVAAQAIAPNGTIGIVVESTPSGDPFFSVAEQRTIYEGVAGNGRMTARVVIDPVAARLAKEGVDTSLMEDAHSIDVDRRLAMQAYLQDHVDQAISSTVNLPAPVTDPQEISDIGSILLRYLPRLRGVTFYPDGALAGQPRVPVDLDWALSLNGQAELSTEDSCTTGVCGV